MNLYMDTDLIMAFLFDRSEYGSEVEALTSIMSNVRFERYCTVFCIEKISHISSRRVGGSDAFKAILSRLMRLVKPLEITPDDIVCAVNMNLEDFERAVMVSSAYRKGPGTILALDTRNYVDSPMSVITPSDFLADMRKNGVSETLPPSLIFDRMGSGAEREI